MTTEKKRMPVGIPPDASGITEYRPMSGFGGAVARAYVRRWQLSGIAVSLAVAGAAIVVTPTMDLSRQAEANSVSDAARDTRSTLPVADVEAKTVTVVSLPPENDLQTVSSSTEPQVQAEAEAKADLPEVSVNALSGDFGSLDMKDLVSAVDNLGIRVAEAEKKLAVAGETQEEMAAAPKFAETELPVDAKTKSIKTAASLSEDDSLLHDRLSARVEKARADKDSKTLAEAEAELAMFMATLETLIEFKIVDRKDAKSGFWRYPAEDPKTKQFYLVVEAIVNGKAVNWAIKDADSGRVVSSKSFGLMVNEKTFAEFAEDKSEDGRIDDLVVGIKPIGRIGPVWSIQTDGYTISGVDQ